MTDHDLLTPEEAADVLRIDYPEAGAEERRRKKRRRVEDLLRAGTIPGMKIGGAWRVSRVQLLAHVQAEAARRVKGEGP